MGNPFDQPSGPAPDFVSEQDHSVTQFDSELEPDRGARASSQAAGERRSSSRRRSSAGRPGDRKGQKQAPPPGEVRDAESSPYDVAKQIVLRQLTMAPRSRKQLEDKLRQRGCDDDVAQDVLDRLTEVGLIDDAAYARMLVRSQQAGRGLARRGLAQELRKKGVDSELAQAALDEEISEDSEKERARELVAKKMRSMHGLDATVQTRRLAGMLARKGYPSSIAWSVIKDAVRDAPEHQRDVPLLSRCIVDAVRDAPEHQRD